MKVKDAVEIVETFLKKFNKSKQEFLDKRQAEWAVFISENFIEESPDADPSDPRRKERMALLKEITSEIAKYCRRDSRITKALADARWSKFDKLDKMRKDDNITPFNHPTILALKADLAYLRKDFTEGLKWIDKAIDANEAFPFETQKRERIRLGFLKARGLYGSEKYDEAIELADSNINRSEEFSKEEDKKALAFTCTSGKGSVPVGVYAFFAGCDTRINHPSWNKEEKLREEFTFLWNKSISDYKVPQSWNPPLQIAVISDPKWCNRCADYTKNIAKELYVILSDTKSVKTFRSIKVFWVGLPIRMPYKLSSAVAASLLLLLLYTGDASTKVKEAIPKVAVVVAKWTDGKISVSDAEHFFNEELNSKGDKSLDEIDLNVCTEIEDSLEAEINESILLAYNGEGSGERI